MVHLENLLCFHYLPLFDDKSGSFSQTWPSPHTMLLQGGHFERTDPTLYGGEGGRNGEIVQKSVPLLLTRIVVEDSDLVYRGQRLVVPADLRNDMKKEIHRAHIGIGGCLRRAQELLYWPRMNVEVKDYVSRCSTCRAFRPEEGGDAGRRCSPSTTLKCSN